MRIFFFIFLLFTSVSLSAQETQCPRNETDCTGKCGLFTDIDNDGFCDLGKRNEENITQKTVDSPQKETLLKKEEKTYPILLLSIALLLLYIVSLVLVKIKIYRKATHRKIWNIALIITFLVSACLGVILAVFINHKTLPDNYLHLLKHHVDFGIAMTMISIFHIIWHFNYFKAIFIKKRG